MKKQLSIFLLLLSLVFSISAQKPSEVERNLRTNVGYLASDALEGRRTGETGATVAAGYVANMFANYKLEQGVVETDAKGKKRTNFLQKFPYVSGIELGTDNAFSINGASVNLKTDWMPVGYSPNSDITNSQIIFAGYGIASDELKYNDYNDLDANGKIVLVLAGTPDNGNPHSEFSRFGIHAKANIAKSKGAKALLIISGEENFADDKLAQLDFNQTLGETAIPAIVISRKTAADIFGEKDTSAISKIEKLAAARKDKPENVRLNITYEPKSAAKLKINLVQKQAEAFNVIGIIEGRDAVLKNEAIIIGAHYDHLGKGGEGSLAVNSNEIHHGADDNASGVSAMLELARQFRKEKNNKRTLIFIAFGGEEEGLLGSKYYVNNPVFPLDKTVAMINMDMVGRLKENKLTIGGIGTANLWKDLVENTNLNMSSPETLKISLTSGKKDLELKNKLEGILENAGNLGAKVEVKDKYISIFGVFGKGKMAEALKSISEISSGYLIKNFAFESENEIPSESEIEKAQKPKIIRNLYFSLQLNQDGFGPSDHSSFYGKKISVLFFFTGTHTDYHKPTDTAEKINYQGLEKITMFVGSIVKSIDQNPKRPTFAVAPSSGMGEGRRGFNVSLGTVPSYADNTNDGLLLDGVRDSSPAAKAGILAGDKIIKMAGRDVNNISDYVFVLGEMKAGEEYEIVVMRGAEKLTLKIVPDARK